MQQRFCLCGASIWVRYRFSRAHWLVFFYRSEAGKTGMHACPRCGRVLNIENLL